MKGINNGVNYPPEPFLEAIMSSSSNNLRGSVPEGRITRSTGLSEPDLRAAINTRVEQIIASASAPRNSASSSHVNSSNSTPNASSNHDTRDGPQLEEGKEDRDRDPPPRGPAIDPPADVPPANNSSSLPALDPSRQSDTQIFISALDKFNMWMERNNEQLVAIQATMQNLAPHLEQVVIAATASTVSARSG